MCSNCGEPYFRHVISSTNNIPLWTPPTASATVGNNPNTTASGAFLCIAYYTDICSCFYIVNNMRVQSYQRRGSAPSLLGPSRTAGVSSNPLRVQIPSTSRQARHQSVQAPIRSTSRRGQVSSNNSSNYPSTQYSYVVIIHTEPVGFTIFYLILLFIGILAIWDTDDRKWSFIQGSSLPAFYQASVFYETSQRSMSLLQFRCACVAK